MQAVKKFIGFFSNKYLLAGLAFTLWILFFDHNNFFRYLEYQSELKEIKQKKVYYQGQIEKTRKDAVLTDTKSGDCT